MNYTGELVQQDIQDYSHNKQTGFNFSTSIGNTEAGKPPQGTTTFGVQNTGSQLEQTTKSVMGLGNVIGANNNRDVNNAQEITKEQVTGALDANVTIDNRLFTEAGRASIVNDYETIKEGTKIAVDVVSSTIKQYKTVKAFDELAQSDPAKAQEVLNYIQANQAIDPTQQTILPFMAVGAGILWLIDKGTNAWDAYQISKAIDEGRYEDAKRMAAIAGVGVAVGAIIPGAASAIKIVKNVAKHADEVGDAVRAEKVLDDVVGDGVKAIPPLRQEYINEVSQLKDTASKLKASGVDAEQIARMLHEQRRALGVKFKDLTPPSKLNDIYQRNIQLYGDKLGPSIDWLRAHGKSWEQIIESAARTGGKDLGF